MATTERKMSGMNVWFIIEILSFYGYILSAMLFIIEHSVKSSMGMKPTTKALEDRYKVDFLNFHRKDCDWYAFVTILTFVNVCLMIMNTTVFKDERKKYD